MRETSITVAVTLLAIVAVAGLVAPPPLGGAVADRLPEAMSCEVRVVYAPNGDVGIMSGGKVLLWIKDLGTL